MKGIYTRWSQSHEFHFTSSATSPGGNVGACAGSNSEGNPFCVIQL